jgi:carbamoyltransferase
VRNLLLTLGHNSSAILIEDNTVVWGYETERLTGVKSDSRFPLAVLEHTGLARPDLVYATHWAPDGNLFSMGKKYWDPAFFDGVPIRSLTMDRTHHDTHMAAAMCYAGPDFPRERAYGLVIDGFGTCGEHLSVYDISDPSRNILVRRVHGYSTSLGLWYQYATAFLGLKMHEDEYKLLGYEVHCPADRVDQIEDLAYERSQRWLENLLFSPYGSKYDPLYSVDALPNVKELIFKHLTEVAGKLGVADPSSTMGRAVISRYVQQVLENVVLALIVSLHAKHVVLSGGVFYNVKLNKRIVDLVDGQVCVYPLAGDQGNAIGLYSMDNPSFKFPKTLNWGTRSLRNVGQVPNLTVCNEQDALDMCQRQLERVGFVNLVRGSMEFGPRAMCNTSTLAVPTMENVDRINQANNRNTVMPMAPVMKMGRYQDTFHNWDRVWKSYRHMVVALEYVGAPDERLRGAAHEYRHPYLHWTGRPQVVDKDDVFMNILLDGFDHPLINTSFNFHGHPIALGMDSIIENHMMQWQRDNSFYTVVVRNAE